MDPDQTAPTLFEQEAPKTFRQRTNSDDICCDWRFKCKNMFLCREALLKKVDTCICANTN